ncbi:MAG: ABC transporter ATP-binding protein [Candidatus Levybacteria bacterium CG10_big_fil_rev_8_21_14_0_10_35_13]|nr:MAG: ABC transporter ATP-binding protein [Candidatus Levybacteria bacterium CG10_big_fil_rev_8_21_14_0_10_35_13]
MLKSIPKKPFSFGLLATKPHKKWAVVAISSVLTATAFDRFSVVVLGRFTDSIATQTIVFETVWIWGLTYPAILLAAGGFWRISGFTGMRWFMNLRLSAYQSLFEYITLHSKDYFNSRFAGALANKMSNAVDGTESVLENFLWRFMPLIVGLFWYIIFAWFSNPWLGIIIFFWSILFLSINLWFARKIQPRSYEFAKSLSTLKGRIVDSLSNISLVHESAYLRGEREYINKYIKKQRDRGLSEWQLSEWMLFTNNIFIFFFMALMIGTSIYLFQQNSVSVGTVVMIIAIVGELTGQLFFIGMEIKTSTKYYGEAKEGLEEILSEHIIIDNPNAKDVVFSKGAITIESIDFEYENAKVFKNFSVKIPAGQKVGFVGRSGAGKTTLVSLILRHFDIQKGEIKIDGHKILDITLESLRRAIAFVPQDTSLFHRTILENIQYSSPGSSVSDVKHAAKLAQIDSFIESLPQGYNTMVGERGVKLSGGQRQRIAIARAFLKNSPILILDEATSSLDSESENAIQMSLEELMKNKTVIAIAHRLSTLKKMDRIVIIENGKIVEDGLPENLLKKEDGVFKRMWDHQVKGFIIDD